MVSYRVIEETSSVDFQVGIVLYHVIFVPVKTTFFISMNSLEILFIKRHKTKQKKNNPPPPQKNCRFNSMKQMTEK